MSSAAEPFDVIVAGAGPGGSNAAAVALAGGMHVAQIDKAIFPRVKPCAGGMTMKTCRALRLEYAPWIRGTARTVEFNMWRGSGHRFSHRERDVVHLVSRPQFDNALIEQNRGSERFTLYSGERIVDASYDGMFTVQTPKRTLRARQLIAADGAYSTVNRIFDIARPRMTAVAIEVNIARHLVDLAREPFMCFDFGAIESGYGWVFPKDDHWSVGLYTYSRGLKGLRARLIDYVRAKGLMPGGEALTFDAHQIPVGGYRQARDAPPVYVVGDAGGFADALTGEGIYHAVESGRVAGETAVLVHRQRRRNPDAAAYRRRLWRTVLPDTMFTYYAARQFYRHLDAGVRTLASPGVWRVLVEGYADAATMTKSVALGPRYLSRSLLRHSLRHEPFSA